MTPSRFKAVSAASVPRSPVAAEPTVLPITTRRLWVSIALTLPSLLMAMHVAWPVDLSAWVDAASREFGWPRGARAGGGSGAHPRADPEARRPGRTLVRAVRAVRRCAGGCRLGSRRPCACIGQCIAGGRFRIDRRVPLRARLATPVSSTVGIGRGAKEGVLIKDAEALELMEKVDTSVIDKTGTLTEGKPSVQVVVAAPGFDAAQVPRWAASLEASSEHPLAAAIIEHARNDGLALVDVSDFSPVAGQGVRGVIDGGEMRLGNAQLLADANVDPGLFDAAVNALRQQGQTGTHRCDGRR